MTPSCGGRARSSLDNVSRPHAARNSARSTLLATGRLAGALALLLPLACPLFALEIKDLVRIKGSEPSQLVGFGLVVGLKGTGDGGKFIATMQPLARSIRHLINEDTVAADLKDAKNVAMVALEASTPSSGVREGDRVDVYVSAIGAKSLQGGRLLVMPMLGPLPNSPVYAYASGPITIEDENIPTTGVIRRGAQMVRDIRPRVLDANGRMTLVIKEANATFQTAASIVGQINGLPGMNQIARAVDQKNIVVQIPKADLVNPTTIIAEILGTHLDPAFVETGARVRINERTGTIVVSGDVQISPVAISQGALTINMITPKPEPTEQAPVVKEHRFIAVDPENRGGAKLADLIEAFNQLQVSVQDRIDIIKLIHDMGKLHAELVFE